MIYKFPMALIYAAYVARGMNEEKTWKIWAARFTASTESPTEPTLLEPHISRWNLCPWQHGFFCHPLRSGWLLAQV